MESYYEHLFLHYIAASGLGHVSSSCVAEDRFQKWDWSRYSGLFDKVEGFLIRRVWQLESRLTMKLEATFCAWEFLWRAASRIGLSIVKVWSRFWKPFFFNVEMFINSSYNGRRSYLFSYLMIQEASIPLYTGQCNQFHGRAERDTCISIMHAMPWASRRFLYAKSSQFPLITRLRHFCCLDPMRWFSIPGIFLSFLICDLK